MGIGECGLLRGLSFDDVEEYEDKLAWACANIDIGCDALWEALSDFPSIQFGVEQAFLSLGSERSFYPLCIRFCRRRKPYCDKRIDLDG